MNLGIEETVMLIMKRMAQESDSPDFYEKFVEVYNYLIETRKINLPKED